MNPDSFIFPIDVSTWPQGVGLGVKHEFKLLFVERLGCFYLTR